MICSQCRGEVSNRAQTSVYYLGCLVGCLLGGWIAEKVGRIKVIALGSIWGVLGASLQTSAMNANWMICGMPHDFAGDGHEAND